MANARQHWITATTNKARRRHRCGMCTKLTDSTFYINNVLHCDICELEADARQIAKDQGAKIEINPLGGIDVDFCTGKKVHYLGWVELQRDFVIGFDLTD